MLQEAFSFSSSALTMAIASEELQKLGTGRVMPEKFTHGSSEQRVTWFKRGLDTGDPRNCDTFGNTGTR